MIDKSLTYAVVGANTNPEKYGYTVFKDLLDAGYKVVPINPNEPEILGQKVYPLLAEYPWTIDVVIFVTQPEVTEQVLHQVKDLWIKKVWMQPWAQSTEAIDFCEKNEISCTHDACIMIAKNTK